MALNLVLVPQRQSSKGMALAWGDLEGVQAYEVFVAHKRLSPERCSAAEQDGGARAEAKRLVHDALLVFPGLPSARALAAETG